ncbi:MAG TPA: TolC family protein [Pyrinomonadaceae bacterium]|nr:TolC family protein [Pyrinomonadaceae bacterium]
MNSRISIVKRNETIGPKQATTNGQATEMVRNREMVGSSRIGSTTSSSSQREFATFRYQQTIQNAFKEVSDASFDIKMAREIRAQQDLLVTTLRDRSRLAHLRYEGGVGTLLNALASDRELFDAELNLTRTKRNELLSLVQLYKALSGGWQQ